MNNGSILVFFAYTTIIVSWTWARFRFFKILSRSSRISSLFYDPIVIIQIANTYYCIFKEDQFEVIPTTLGLTAYILGLTMFFWSIRLVKHLNFAFSDRVGAVVVTGPYSIVRHPIYLSYAFVWLSSTLMFKSAILWITLIYLMVFYFVSAKKEEKVILESEYSREYLEYKKKVGMFSPRILRWIQ